MPILWVGVSGETGKEGERAIIEANAIALLSGLGRTADLPSESWLGQFADNATINMSGLWNTRHVGTRCDPAFLDLLEKHVGEVGR